jgi:hypothetical protein
MQRKAGAVFLGASVVQALITAGVGVLLFALFETYSQAEARQLQGQRGKGIEG